MTSSFFLKTRKENLLLPSTTDVDRDGKEGESFPRRKREVDLFWRGDAVEIMPGKVLKEETDCGLSRSERGRGKIIQNKARSSDGMAWGGT